MAIVAAWGCTSFSTNDASSPDASVDAATEASTADAADVDGAVDESTCPGATLIDGFEQPGRVTIQGEWSASYGNTDAGLALDGGALHASLPAHTGSTAIQQELSFLAPSGTVRSACASFHVRVLEPTDFSPYIGTSRTVLAYFTSTTTKDTYQSLILGHTGAYFESYPTPLNQPIIIPPDGARISILVRYPEREVRYFVDGVQKALVTELTFDAGAPIRSAQFALGIDQEDTTPAVHVVYDDVRLRFDP